MDRPALSKPVQILAPVVPHGQTETIQLEKGLLLPLKLLTFVYETFFTQRAWAGWGNPEK